MTGNMAEAIRAYLRSQGWTEGKPGLVGTIWTAGPGGSEIGVCHEIAYGSAEWRGVIQRLPGGSFPEIEARILHPDLDPELLPAQAALEYLATHWAACTDGGLITEAGWQICLDPADIGTGKPMARRIAEATEAVFYAITRDGREIKTRRPAAELTQRLRDRQGTS